MAEPTGNEQLEQIRARSRRLAGVPFDPHCARNNCIPCDLVASAADVQRLLKQLGDAREEWSLRNPSGTVDIVTYKADAMSRIAELNPDCAPVHRLIGEWKRAEQLPEDGDRG